jgi:hypothetical protein
MIGQPPLVIHFDEIKHYFKTGEHLAKPTILIGWKRVRNHLTWGNGKASVLNCRNASYYTNYFKGIHSFKPHKQKQLVTHSDRPEELFAALNEISEVYVATRLFKSLNFKDIFCAFIF